MISIVLKYFFIILCSICIFSKLQNFTFSKSQKIITLFLSTSVSFILYFTRKNFHFLTLILIVLFLTALFYKIFKEPLNSTLTFTTISFGISYISYLISSFIVAPISYLMFSNFNESALNFVTILLIGICQTTLCCLLFKIKRLKKGIANYKSKLTTDYGVLISLSLLFFASLANFDNNCNNNRYACYCSKCCWRWCFFNDGC